MKMSIHLDLIDNKIECYEALSFKEI